MTETKYIAGYDPLSRTNHRTIRYGFDDGTVISMHRGLMTESMLKADVYYHAIQESKNGGIEIYNNPSRPVANEVLSGLEDVCKSALEQCDRAVKELDARIAVA